MSKININSHQHMAFFYSNIFGINVLEIYIMNRCNNVIEIFSIPISSEFLNIVFHSIAKCKKRKKKEK